MSRFSDTLMEHFQDPANRGVMECSNSIGRGSLGGHSPFVTLYLRIRGSAIVDAMFEAAGCGVTIACGSKLTEMVQGRTLEYCSRITADDLSKALDGIPPDKKYCASVVISALQDAISKDPNM